MTGLALSIAGGYGIYLLYTAVALGWTGWAPGPRTATTRRRRSRIQDWLSQAGLGDVRPSTVLAAIAVFCMAGTTLGYAVFGAALPAVLLGAFAATFPPASYRRGRRARRAAALDAWPRLIEEIRIQTGSLGRSIPQALFAVGAGGPDELRPAFAAAQREWFLSTDFERSVAVLKTQLADPTADIACETLLVADELGGADLDRRLVALAEDRAADAHARKDARARQAGVRFARSFVLLVPGGMAVAGMSIGSGRAAYQTPLGQMAAAFGIAALVACWMWSGRIMRLPETERVFRE